jgi:tRNA C32,U32 (ribose-2'-O)-methylase TrmJ
VNVLLAVSIAFTRRSGAVRDVFPSLRHLQSALQAQSMSLQAQGGSHAEASMALVFGREESGLSHEEQALCSHCCSIAASKSCGSLNLSHAVAVVLSQLYELQTEGPLWYGEGPLRYGEDLLRYEALGRVLGEPVPVVG